MEEVAPNATKSMDVPGKVLADTSGPRGLNRYKKRSWSPTIGDAVPNARVTHGHTRHQALLPRVRLRLEKLKSKRGPVATKRTDRGDHGRFGARLGPPPV